MNKLYQSYRIGKLKLRNRLVMSAMNENMSNHEGAPTEYQLAYYEERARGGVGLIITGNAFIDDESSQITSGQMGIYSHSLIPAYARLVDRVHLAGAAIVIQLSHAGRQTFLPWNRPLLAPSAVACTVVGETPKEMDEADIKKLIENYGQAAVRAKMAGFDGVEVHCGHGYLLSEFISPHTNKRTDKYGGSLENRMRLPLEVIAYTRKLVGLDFVIGVKFNAREELADGITAEEGCIIAKMFAHAGVDYLNVSAGTYETGDEQCQYSHLPRGYNVALAGAVKREVNIPVIAVGSINDPELAEDIVETGKADMVAMGRPLIADPYLPVKAAAGNYDDIRMCLRCNECQGRLAQNKQIVCTLNPEVGREGQYPITLSEDKKTVAVIGGGPAGLEAARVAALRGHKVILLEKRDRLGGACLPVNNPGFKRELDNIPRYYRAQLEKLGVDIQTGQEGTVESIKEMAPDVVVVAVGGVPQRPDILGVNSSGVSTAIEYLNSKFDAGERVVVIGAGLVGLETALKLSEEGRDVTVIELREQDAIGTELNPLAAYRLMTEVNAAGIKIMAGHEVVSFDNGVSAREAASGEIRRFEADHVLLAVGISPQTTLGEELTKSGFHTIEIGDCVEPSNIRMVITKASDAARYI